MKHLRLIVYSVVGTLALLALIFPDVCLAKPLQISGTTLTLTSTPGVDENGNPIKGRFSLAATLTTSDGKPVTGRSITFYEQVTFLGSQREAFLGQGVTDSTGLTGIVYQPASTGSDLIIARFAGDTQYGKADTKATLDVSSVTPTIVTEPAPFAPISGALSAGFFVLVLAVWAILLGVFLRTTLAIKGVEQGSFPPVTDQMVADLAAKYQSARR